MLVLALVAITAVTRTASAIPECGHYEGSVWVIHQTGGVQSDLCKWKTALLNGSVTPAAYQAACHLPPYIYPDDLCFQEY